MKVLGAHHVSFAVRDLARARRFYEEVLGLREIPRPDFGFPGAWYRAGDTEVHLIVPPPGHDTGSPPPRLTPLANHAAFRIDDYDAAEERLRASGLEFLPTHRDAGQLFVRDPDGNLIELAAPRASS